MKRNIYSLGLHESTSIPVTIYQGENNKVINYTVTRVPGGWIYVLMEEPQVNFFVAYSEEFKRSPDDL